MRARKMTAVCGMPILPELIQEGGVHIPTEDITPHFRTQVTHIHITHGELPEAKPSTGDSSTLHIHQRQMWQSLQAWPSLNGKWTFARSNLKVNIHTCFYTEWATINRMFPLSKRHRKPHINEGVWAQAYIPSYKQKHAKTLTDSN